MITGAYCHSEPRFGSFILSLFILFTVKVGNLRLQLNEVSIHHKNGDIQLKSWSKHVFLPFTVIFFIKKIQFYIFYLFFFFKAVTLSCLIFLYVFRSWIRGHIIMGSHWLRHWVWFNNYYLITWTLSNQ